MRIRGTTLGFLGNNNSMVLTLKEMGRRTIGVVKKGG